MIEIPLDKGYVAIIDDADAALVCGRHWYANVITPRHIYAATKARVDGKRVNLFLHRLLTGAQKGMVVDHIDQDTLNNRRANLRVIAHGQNIAHSHRVWGAHKYKGVYPCRGRWRAAISHNKKKIMLGVFNSEVEAALAYNAAAIRLRGEQTFLNDVSDAYTPETKKF